MSHSLHSSAESATQGRLRSIYALSRMLEEGRSFSGRERNCCFLNTRGTRFANVSAVSGLDYEDDGRAVAVADWDSDGDLDLWISNRTAPRLRFLRNELRDRGHFVALRLVGAGKSNRDAIGARVEIVVEGERPIVRTLRAGEGFLAQSSKWLQFVLPSGHANEPGESKNWSVRVRWPDSARQEFRGLARDRRYILRQGEAAREWHRPGSPGASLAALRPSVQPVKKPSQKARIPLITLLRMPRVEWLDNAGAPQSLQRPAAGASRKPLLINLWASWCTPCVAELREIEGRGDELRAAGLDVLALSVDGLGDDRSNPAAAVSRLREIGFSFRSGRATKKTTRMLQHLHDRLTATRRPLPVPSSFLVDGAGRLAVIYKGRLRIDDLLQDLGHSGRSRTERVKRAALLPGSVVGDELVERAALGAETKTRFLFASDMSEVRAFTDAIEHYRDLLVDSPDFAEARVNLARLYLDTGDATAAARELEKVLASRPKMAEAHFNLGLVRERQGDDARAATRYQEALRFKPGYADAHNSLGVLLAKHGRLDLAVAQFQRAVESDPELATAQNHLGLVYLQRGELPAATRHLEAAVRLDPQLGDAWNNLGMALRRQGDLTGAVERYRRAVSAQPEFAEAHNNLGAALMALGRLEEAETAFGDALRLRPGFEMAQRNLARVRELREKQ